METPPFLPHHPRISDAAARALVLALMDAELLGVALLRGRERVHALVNAKYQALVGEPGTPVLGRPIGDLFPPARNPEAPLLRVLEGHGPTVQREVPFAPQGSGPASVRLVTMTYHAVDEPGDSILVLAEDVTERVRERERADLFVELVGDLLPAIDARAVVRSIVTRTQVALGAKSSSIFRLSEDGDTLAGAVGEWDWTRTSFSVRASDWPSVGATLSSGHAFALSARDAKLSEVGWFETRGIVSALCVPLRARERNVGVLFFDFDAPRTFDPGAIAFAENVAAHCALALLRA